MAELNLYNLLTLYCFKICVAAHLHMCIEIPPKLFHVSHQTAFSLENHGLTLRY